MSPLQTKFVDEIIPIFDETFKNLFLVILHSRWRFWPSSLHKGYPWYKFPSQPFLEVETPVGGEGIVSPLPPTSHIPCMLTIVAKRCTFRWNKTCAEVVFPVRLLSLPAALLKVVFRTTCFVYSVLPVSFEILRWIFQ